MPPSTCPFCDQANPAGAKFCNECGSPLHLAPCKRCGAVNGVADTRCHRCGAATAAGGAAAEAESLDAQLREVEAELRILEENVGEAPTPASTFTLRPTRHPGLLASLGQDLRESERQSESAAPGPGDVAVRDSLGQDLQEFEQQSEPAAPGPGDIAARETLGQDLREFEQRSEPAAQGSEDIAARETLGQDLREFEQQSEPVAQGSEDIAVREAAPFASDLVAEPRRRRHGYAAVLAAVIALTVPAGGYVYYELSPHSTVGDVAEVAPASPASSSRIDAAVEERAAAPASPIAALSQASGEAAESRVDAGIGEPPPAAAPTPEATPEGRCPPAVQAMALCDRLVREERP